MHKGNYNASISLPDHILHLVTWWQSHVYDAIRHVHVPCPEHYIASDASNLGWGGIIDESYTTRGQWSSQEVESHINIRELQAAFFMLKAFGANKHDTHIRLKLYNTTAVACINRLASTKTQLMKLTKQMWCWALERNIILSAEYLPGYKNSTADAESRAVENTDAEWMISKPIFEAICDHFGQPKIDLFASRLNKQLATYYAWRPDPEAAAIDAFMQPWQHDLMHAFPPFRITGRVLQKTARDQATIILVAPIWPTQAWFSVALRMLIATPRVLPPESLTLPQNPTLKHPLTKMRLAAMMLSGNPSKQQDFLTKLWPSSPNHGEREPTNNTTHTSPNGLTFVTKGNKYRFGHCERFRGIFIWCLYLSKPRLQCNEHCTECNFYNTPNWQCPCRTTPTGMQVFEGSFP